jgi:UTP--glucose-1-phosphate uridylyltransferase
MHISRAVVTAANPAQRSLPLQRLVDRDGHEKSALQLIIEEIASSGIKEICLVVMPEDQPRFLQAAGSHADFLTFVNQDEPRGYGDALLRAREFVGQDPFLHLVGDHLYLSRGTTRCAQQLVEIAQTHQCAVSAVQQTRETELSSFGAVAGRRVPQHGKLYEVTSVLEKPTPTQAEQQLVTAGLRSGYYLCVFGMHVLTPQFMDLLDETLSDAPAGARLTLSPALAELAQRERYLALEVDGSRHDIGGKYGLLNAQLAHALCGRDRDLILTQLLQLLADQSAPIAR